jgi:hypothetical protein
VRHGGGQIHSNHMEQEIDKLAIDSIIQEYESFEIETDGGKKEVLHLYPLQLGRQMLISKRLIDLDIILEKIGDSDKEDPLKAMWEVCSEKPMQVAEIIAIATLRTKEDIDTKLKERADMILWAPNMTTDALTVLLAYIVNSSDSTGFMSAIRSLKTLRVNISQSAKMDRIATAAKVSGGSSTV